MLLALIACTTTTLEKIDPVPTVEETCSIHSITLPDTYALVAPVTVRLDDLGVPHLQAQNDQDLFFAAGYQVASDRLFAMDQLRRAANGTRAAVWGPDYLDDDYQSRTFGFANLACPSLVETAARAPEVYQLVTAYVSGVNRRVAEVNAGKAPLPEEFGPDGLDYAPEPFSAADVIAMGRRISLGFTSALDYDLLTTVASVAVGSYEDVPIHEPGSPRFIMGDVVGDTATPAPAGPAAPGSPGRDLHDLVDDPEALLAAIGRLRSDREVGNGSNNWAVNGAHTFNGRPLLANDPHAGFYDPSPLYLSHLDSASAGGSFNVAGFSFLGIPGVQLGHNEKVAWAATTNQADALDLWGVDIDEDDVAWIAGEGIPVETRSEPIAVRQSDGSFTEEPFEVRSVPGYGVLLGEEIIPAEIAVFADGALMVRWTGLEANAEEAQYIGLDRAENLADFEAAIDWQVTGIHNWVGADATGIRYKVHGLLPIRGGNPGQVQDADDPDTLWSGWLGPEALPYLDGSQDFIVSANNDPWGHTADDDPFNDAFYYASFFDPGFRAERIASSLEAAIAAGPVSVEQMMAIQLDTTSSLAPRLVPLLEDAWAAVDTDETLADFRGRTELGDAVARLGAWDADMAPDSTEAALFSVWSAFASRRVLAGDFSLLFNEIDNASPVTMSKLQILALERDIPSLTDGKAHEDLLLALDDALAWSAEQQAALGREPRWGDIHAAAFRESLGGDELVAVGGDASSPNVSECSMWSGDTLASTCVAGSGALFRTVTSFGDDGVPETWFNHAHGNAGTPGAWEAGTYELLPFREAEVAAHTVETWEIVP